MCTYNGSDSTYKPPPPTLFEIRIRKPTNDNETTAQTRRKCVHKTISLCRHYPEEFWFVLVTRSAINHSHAWHISTPPSRQALARSLSVAESLVLRRFVCVCGARVPISCCPARIKTQRSALFQGNFVFCSLFLTDRDP